MILPTRAAVLTLALVLFFAVPARPDVRPVSAKEDIAGLPAAAARLYYDVKAGRLLSLVWVFEGTFRGPPPSDKLAQAYSGAVEWHRDSPAK